MDLTLTNPRRLAHTPSFAADSIGSARLPELRAFKRIRIAAVQKLLKELGYDTQDDDGILGHETQNAILWFQRKNAIRVDGKVNSQLIVLMQNKRDALEAVTR